MTSFLVSAGCGRDEPSFVSVLLPTDTYDTAGPYRVEAQVFAANGVFRMLMRLQQATDSEVFGDLRFQVVEEEGDGGRYLLELPGRPAGTWFRYYLQVVDGKSKGGGRIATYPDGAPATLAEFCVLPCE
ncbi:MAG: hypothetical protein HY903_06355 [Deltaproteobacteria bacterium]|nr:hypothetical protein [Deltaproteobacteria bacterium]